MSNHNNAINRQGGALNNQNDLVNRLDEIEENVMGELKDFQRATVERIDHLYRNGIKRILVSDEVGLGKTLIARGTIAKFVKLRYEEEDDLVKVVYICSNGTIAQQNLDKLRIVHDVRVEDTNTSRLSMQHLNIFNDENDENVKRDYIQLIPLTPQTSFKITNSQGLADERALMYSILRHMPELKGFDDRLSEFLSYDVGNWDYLKLRYGIEVKACDKKSRGSDGQGDHYLFYMTRELSKRLSECRINDEKLLTKLRRYLRRGKFTRRESRQFIITLRRIFTEISLDKMDPDIIIMDEFQRFKYLLNTDANSDIGMLTNKFFNAPDLRILMLSATPYKMYSTLDEIDDAQVDEHYKEFFDVINFLNTSDEEKIKFNKVWTNYSRELKEFSNENEYSGEFNEFSIESEYSRESNEFSNESESSVDKFSSESESSVDKFSSESESSVDKFSSESESSVDKFTGENDFSIELKEFSTKHDSLIVAKNAAQSLLYQNICRTERIAERNAGDIIDDSDKHNLIKVFNEDITSYMDLDKFLKSIQTNTRTVPMDYIKSSPYLLSFMKNYKLKRSIQNYFKKHPDELYKANKSNFWIDREDIDNYNEIRYNHARLNQLMGHVFKDNAELLLWVPPSKGYYPGEGVFKGVENFSKTLIFSSWEMVPRMVSSLVSYEAERKTIGKLSNGDIRYFEKNHYTSPRIRYSLNEGRPGQMTLMSMIYPSSYLSMVYVPIECLNDNMSLDEIQDLLKSRIKPKLDQFKENEENNNYLREDYRWYYLAPLLLDCLDEKSRSPEFDLEWYDCTDYVEKWFKEFKKTLRDNKQKGGKGFEAHINSLEDTFDALVYYGKNDGREYLLHYKGSKRPIFKLGRKPADLLDVLVDLAIASPANCIYRTYRRELSSYGHLDLRISSKDDGFNSNESLKDALAGEMKKYTSLCSDFAFDFLHMMNGQEIMATIDCIYRNSEDAYWKNILRYSKEGNIQAVFDEYVHLLSNGLDKNNESRIKIIHERFMDSMNLRTTPYDIDTFDNFKSRALGEEDVKPMNIRTHFAVSFTKGAGNDVDTNRKTSVRDAFNSPFRPFVLASTSIGQEGLDFHNYCRRVVHWNLPSNPIDLEQREGRINRFACLAIRQNIAQRYGNIDDFRNNIWMEMFEKATEMEKMDGASDLIPYWGLSHSEDMIKIERILPLYPFSRDEAKYDRLINVLAIYRLTLGQARQEELVNSILSNNNVDNLDELFINLSPYYKKDLEEFDINDYLRGLDAVDKSEVFDIGDANLDLVEDDSNNENTNGVSEDTGLNKIDFRDISLYEDNNEIFSEFDSELVEEDMDIELTEFDSELVEEDMDIELTEFDSELVEEDMDIELTEFDSKGEENMDIKLKYCFNCGAELVIKNSKFCYNCGQDLRIENLDLEAESIDSSVNENSSDSDLYFKESVEYGFPIKSEIFANTTSDGNKINVLNEANQKEDIDFRRYSNELLEKEKESNVFGKKLYLWDDITIFIPIDGLTMDFARLEMVVQNVGLEVKAWSPKVRELLPYLRKKKNVLESELGFELNYWESRWGVAVSIHLVMDMYDEDLWEDAMNWHLFMAKRFEEVFSDIIREYSEKHPFKYDNSLRTRYWRQLDTDLNNEIFYPLEIPHSHPWFRLVLDNLPIRKGRIELNAYLNTKPIMVSLYLEKWMGMIGLYKYLHRQRKEIEEELNMKLIWTEKNSRCHIHITYPLSIKDESRWQEAIDWQLETAEKFKRVFDPKIKEFFERK